ncbi:MAG: FIST C-terminal domain-containing protein [Synergistaceae bacterium]|nr:FIST C-terminal domain-containing protein [Synergistaceae bacterium]
MKSATAISYELDDIAAATEELTSQIRDKFSLCKNTFAILHGQPEMDISELSSAINRELGCCVIGGTTAAAAMITNEGYHELAVVLHVITDDNCLFAASISGSMGDSPQKEIEKTYQAAYRNLKEQSATAEPNLVICVSSILQNYSSDDVVANLSSVCGDLPVFGYIAADDFEFCKQEVFLDGEAGGDRMAILLISGEINPIFQVESLAGKQTLDKRLVTKAHDNIICEIDGKPAYEYIAEFPFIDDQTKVLFNYQFFVEMNNADDNDGISVSRALNTYDKETGEVMCFANVPQGSYIGLRYCDDKDVVTTSEAGLKEFLNKLKDEKSGYKYSTVLIATCSLRNMFLTDQKNMEGNLVKELLPSELTVSGLYAFGEIAPTSINNNRAVNRFHNATFTMCAF